MPPTWPERRRVDELVPIAVTVNGRLHAAEVEPRLHAADFLRGVLGLTGTHVGCEQGEEGEEVFHGGMGLFLCTRGFQILCHLFPKGQVLDGMGLFSDGNGKG